MKLAWMLMPFGLLLLMVFACTGSDGSDSIVVYSGRSEKLVDPIIDDFSNVTGIEVGRKYASTSILAGSLLEEGDRTPADIFFAQDPGGLEAVEDMLAVLPDRILQLVPKWARSPDGTWVGISGRARVVVYNTDKLREADLPSDIWGFTDPSWKGKIGWPPRNASFQGMVTAMRILWGEERAKQWLEGILENDPQEYEKNTSTVIAVESGEVEVGFVNHYYLHRFLSAEGDSYAARNFYPSGGGPGSLVMVAGAGILKESNNKEEAEQFLEFILSTTAQNYFATETFEYPLVDGIQVHGDLVPLDDIQRPAICLADLSDIQGTQKLLRDVGLIP